LIYSQPNAYAKANENVALKNFPQETSIYNGFFIYKKLDLQFGID